MTLENFDNLPSALTRLPSSRQKISISWMPGGHSIKRRIVSQSGNVIREAKCLRVFERREG